MSPNLKFDLNKFLIFGDSITEFSFNVQPYLLNPDLADKSTGYEFALGPALTRDYARRLDVVLQGYAGYTSRSARSLLPLILKNYHDKEPESTKIKLLYIFFGTNDATKGGIQSVDTSEFKENITYLVKELLSRDIKVILVSPTYHNAKVFEKLDKFDSDSGHRSTERNLEYGTVLKSVSKEFNNVAFLDLYKEFTDHASTLGVKPEDLLVDGVHFNGKGYEAFYNGLKRTIEENFPELSPDALLQNLVEWRESVSDEFITKVQALY